MARPEVTGRRVGDTADATKRTPKSVINNSAEIDPAVCDEIEPSAPAEIASSPTLAHPVARGPPTLALSIRQFCDAHNISHAFSYLLQQRGEGPRVMKVGSRRLISVEEAARWRAARTSTQENAA
jgi:hypothetical protein